MDVFWCVCFQKGVIVNICTTKLRRDKAIQAGKSREMVSLERFFQVSGKVVNVPNLLIVRSGES